jgi:hypothetical protein
MVCLEKLRSWQESQGENMGSRECVDLAVDQFGEKHPATNPSMLVEHCRVALAKYHESPASFRFYHGMENEYPGRVSFESPDPRSEATLEREDFVEKGAIVMAGMLLAEFEGKQITRVVKRGTHVDYFVGEHPDDTGWIMEVGGTDEGSLAGLRSKKRRQLEASPYREPPHEKDGFVSVTRFAPQAAAALDPVSCE